MCSVSFNLFLLANWSPVSKNKCKKKNEKKKILYIQILYNHWVHLTRLAVACLLFDKEIITVWIFTIVTKCWTNNRMEQARPSNHIELEPPTAIQFSWMHFFMNHCYILHTSDFSINWFLFQWFAVRYLPIGNYIRLWQ